MPKDMFNSASQHLTVYSPSTTTISYTVSNALPRSTRSSKLLFVLGNVCRMILCLFVLVIDVAKLQSIFHFQHLPTGTASLQSTTAGRVALDIAKAADWRIVTAGSLFVIFFCLRKGYTGQNTVNQYNKSIELILSRRDTFGSSWSWSTNFYFFPDISIYLNYEIHPNDPNPGHHHP
jgi:hypothetical protein